MAASSPRNDLVKIYRCTDSLVDLCTGRAGVFICILLHLCGGALLVRLEHPGEAAEPDPDYFICGRAEHRAVLRQIVHKLVAPQLVPELLRDAVLLELDPGGRVLLEEEALVRRVLLDDGLERRVLEQGQVADEHDRARAGAMLRAARRRDRLRRVGLREEIRKIRVVEDAAFFGPFAVEARALRLSVVMNQVTALGIARLRPRRRRRQGAKASFYMKPNK